MTICVYDLLQNCILFNYYTKKSVFQTPLVLVSSDNWRYTILEKMFNKKLNEDQKSFQETVCCANFIMAIKISFLKLFV